MGKGKRLALAKKRNAAMEVIIRPLLVGARNGTILSVINDMGKAMMDSLSTEGERQRFRDTLLEASSHIMFELYGSKFEAQKFIVDSHLGWMKQYGYLFKEDV